MARFPVDVPKQRVIKAFELLGFELVREREHIAIAAPYADGTKTPLTMPNHRTVKGSTLRLICRQSDIPRDDFLAAYERAR